MMATVFISSKLVAARIEMEERKVEIRNRKAKRGKSVVVPQSEIPEVRGQISEARDQRSARFAQAEAVSFLNGR
jgi:hypothetical protein